jgi:hypothetical protein
LMASGGLSAPRPDSESMLISAWPMAAVTGKAVPKLHRSYIWRVGSYNLLVQRETCFHRERGCAYVPDVPSSPAT